MTQKNIIPITHAAIWNTLEEEQRKGFHECWTLQVADPASQRSIWILFNLLSSRNGFRRVVEAWAVVSHRKENREVSKLAVKQSQDLAGFRSEGNDASNCVIRL